MSRYALLVALLVMLWATETMAATIGFGDLHNKPNLSPFTSYMENGYKVEATRGDWFVATIFGNEVPAIGSGPLYTADEGTSAITVMGMTGGLFTFGGVDLSSNSAGGTEYTIAGSLSGIEKFTFETTIGDINIFKSIGSPSGEEVDTLTITGTRVAGVTSFNIDNIRVGHYTDPGSGTGPGSCPSPYPDCNVPEPASIMLLGAGLVGIEIWRRTRWIG